MSERRAIVLGGGVAGITAAFRLRERGYSVELIEGHRHLGGRAFTLPRRDGEPPIDNGPHVILGCYDEFRALLRRIGTESRFRRPRRLELGYRDAHGVSCTLKLLPGPVPLTFPIALLRLQGMRFADRLRALRGLIATQRIPTDGGSFASWLARHRQDGAPRRYLWDPMCRSILNAEAEEVDAALMLSTLDQAFGSEGSRAAIWIPAAPWSAIVGEPALARLREEQIEVRLGSRVQSLRIDGDTVTSIVFTDRSERVVALGETVVSALPWTAFQRIAAPVIAPSARRGKPMVTVAFFGDVDRGHPRDALIALVDGDPFHFFCRREGDPAGEFQLISGGARGLEGLSAEEIVARARAQLRRYFPEADTPDDLSARITKEAEATLLPEPGGPLRPAPGPHPSIRNLVLCGDWTDTGLPSTLEGAARSGRDAVDAIWPPRARRLRRELGFVGASLLGLEVALAVFGTSFAMSWLSGQRRATTIDLLAAVVTCLVPVLTARWFARCGRWVHGATLTLGLAGSALATSFLGPLAESAGESLAGPLFAIALASFVIAGAMGRILR